MFKLTLKTDKQIFQYNRDDVDPGAIPFIPYTYPIFSITKGSVFFTETNRMIPRPNFMIRSNMSAIKTEWKIKIKEVYYWIDAVYFDVEELSREEVSLAKTLFD